jgi:hypothetical protein
MIDSAMDLKEDLLSFKFKYLIDFKERFAKLWEHENSTTFHLFESLVSDTEFFKRTLKHRCKALN